MATIYSSPQSHRDTEKFKKAKSQVAVACSSSSNIRSPLFWFPLCSSVSSAFMVLLVPRRSLSLHVRTSTLLRSRLRSHVTCPLRARPLRRRAGAGRRSGRGPHAAAERRGGHLRDFPYTAARSSTRESPDSFTVAPP